MIIVDLEQGTEAWHKWRDLGTPASETAALFGESPYNTEREIFLFKKGRLPAWFIEKDEYIFNKGHEFEEKMRAEVFAMTGEEFKPACIQHPEFPFIIASLDGLFKVGNRFKIFEAKLVGKEVIAKIKRHGVGGIPRHHYIQMQHQLLIAKDAECCIYFAHTLEGDAVVVVVSHDLNLQTEIKEKLIKFNTALINDEVPPMSDKDFEFSANDELFQHLMAIKELKDELEDKYEKSKKDYDAKLKEIVLEAGHRNVASINMKVKIRTMSSPPRINFYDIPEVKALSEEYLSVFKTEGAPYLRAWFPKTKTTKAEA